MSDYSDSEDETHPRRKKLTPEQRKALMATTQLTELEMVEMWNQYKFNFPTGKANTKQLLQLMKKVFPKCTQPDFVVENIQKVFDTNGDGFISIREILIAFSMAMTGSPREKLHWAFRLYDADQSDSIEEEELEDVFVRLCNIAINIENAHKKALNPEPEKPPTPEPEPELEPEPDSEEEREKERRQKKKKALQMQKTAKMEINVKTMSNKMSNRDGRVNNKRMTKAERERKKAAEEKARQEAQAAEEAAALAAAEAAAIKAAEEQAKLEEEQENEDKEPAFDPRENARMTFKFLDTNKDGQLSEDEFVDGCLDDPMMMAMLQSFTCDFLWGVGTY